MEASDQPWKETADSCNDGLGNVAIACSLNSEMHELPYKTIPSDVAKAELKRLFQHSSHYLAGILISLGLGFISFPIFTRIFSISDYGTIELVAKVLLLLTALSKMGLQQSALRYYDGRLFTSDQSAALRYYSTMLFGMALTATGVMLVFWIGLAFAPKYLIARPLTGLLFLVSTLILVRALTSLLWVFLRVQEKTKLYSVFTVSTKVATLATICLFIPWLGRSVRTYYSGTIVVEMIIVIVLSAILLRGRLVSPRCFDMNLFRAGLAFGLPLIFYELAGITLDAGDRVLVRHYLGGNALGYYSVAYGMADYVNNLLIVPINLALAPIYMRLWRTEGQESTSDFLRRAMDLFFMVSAGILAVVMATSHDAVFLFASSKYRGADTLIPTLVAGLLIYTSSAFISAGLMIHKDTFAMAKLVAYSAALNIALNCLLLPRIGLQAAALATVVSYVFCIVLLRRASSRLLPLRIDLRALLNYGFAALAAWYIASRVELGSPVVNLLYRFVMTLVLYGGLLYVVDPRIRALRRYSFRLGWLSARLKTFLAAAWIG